MDNEEKKKYEFDKRQSEGVTAGATQSPMAGLKSAWNNLKTLKQQLSGEKKPLSESEQEDR